MSCEKCDTITKALHEALDDVNVSTNAEAFADLERALKRRDPFREATLVFSNGSGFPARLCTEHMREYDELVCELPLYVGWKARNSMLQAAIASNMLTDIKNLTTMIHEDEKLLRNHARAWLKGEVPNESQIITVASTPEVGGYDMLGKPKCECYVRKDRDLADAWAARRGPVHHTLCPLQQPEEAF